MQASKLTWEQHIQENDKVIDGVKGNVTSNTAEITTLQATVKTLNDDITTIQAKYAATQKLLDETTANLNKCAATIDKLDSKYQRDEEDTMRCQSYY